MRKSKGALSLPTTPVVKRCKKMSFLLKIPIATFPAANIPARTCPAGKCHGREYFLLKWHTRVQGKNVVGHKTRGIVRNIQKGKFKTRSKGLFRNTFRRGGTRSRAQRYQPPAVRAQLRPAPTPKPKAFSKEYMVKQ